MGKSCWLNVGSPIVSRANPVQSPAQSRKLERKGWTVGPPERFAVRIRKPKGSSRDAGAGLEQPQERRHILVWHGLKGGLVALCLREEMALATAAQRSDTFTQRRTSSHPLLSD